MSMWICKKCNEDLEDTFDACWKCSNIDEWKVDTADYTSSNSRRRVINEKDAESNDKKSEQDNTSKYIKSVVSGLIYSCYQTFYVKYGSHVDGMIDAYNRVYESIGHNSRYAAVGMDEKIGYCFKIFLCILIVPLIISLPIWFINKRKNFSGIFAKTTIILIVVLFIFSFVALQNNEWYKISNPNNW